MPDEFPKAARLLDAHHHERTREHAAGAAIVSVVTGQRGVARRAFAAWAADRGPGHLVAPLYDAAAVRRTLSAYPPGTAVLFVPAPDALTDGLATAIAAAIDLARLEPQRAVGLVLSVPELEHMLLQGPRLDVRFPRALLGGLVFANAQAERAASGRLKREQEQLYRSDHEHLLHKLMSNRADIGDLFAVNRRVRIDDARRTFELDFWAEDLKLAIEVDGGQHAAPAQRRRDAQRDEAMAQAGIKTVRIHASKVISDPTATLNQIAALVDARRRELARVSKIDSAG